MQDPAHNAPEEISHMKDVLVHTSISLLGLFEGLAFLGWDASRQPTYCALEEGNLPLVGAGFDELDKNSKDHSDGGTES